MKLSLVVPCYNEEGNVEKFYEEVKKAFTGKVEDYEFVFVNDGSKDNTYPLLKKLYEQHRESQIQVLSFSRNFGKEAAIYAGLNNVKGDVVCLIDADLQQRPEVVLEMLDVMNSDEDIDCVTAYQEERKENKIMSGMKSAFYKLINKVADVPFVNGASDFRLMKRKMVDAVIQMSMKPFVLHHHPKDLADLVYLRLKEPFGENLQKLKRDAAEAFPNQTVGFESLEQKMADSYNSVRVFRNATLLAAIAILFITLMGLIGYINDELQRRSKEIAIRKVNGAESFAILEMLVQDVLWISFPAVVAGTLGAWYVGGLWMEQFAVTVGSLVPYYVCVAIVVLILIVSCVISKTWRIANENPVKSIKSE